MYIGYCVGGWFDVCVAMLVFLRAIGTFEVKLQAEFSVNTLPDLQATWML